MCKTLVPVNDWQKLEFERLGIVKRDPMFQTFATLLDIERAASEAELLNACHDNDINKLH